MALSLRASEHLAEEIRERVGVIAVRWKSGAPRANENVDGQLNQGKQARFPIGARIRSVRAGMAVLRR